MTPTPPTTSRNAPCPCGSGRRFKDCHGALADAAPTPLLSTAQERLAAGELVAAEAACRTALSTTPDHPEAMRILARCEYERGHMPAALRYALRAAQALCAHRLAPAVAYRVWSDLNFMFTQALPGLDIEVANRLRSDYAQCARRAIGAFDDPLVSVVIVAPGDARDAALSLASVSSQTWRRLEVVLAFAGADPRDDGECAAAIRACPFPLRLVARADASEPALAEAGVRMAQGAFVNVLIAGNAFAPSRLQTMLREVAGRGSAWGFSGVEFVDARGRPVAPEDDTRVGAWSERLAALPEADTIGYAFIHQVFVAVDAGNLFFSRPLYDAAGGFRDPSQLWAWDFCLRALWLAEPVHVGSAEYRHRMLAMSSQGAAPTPGDGAAQVAVFARYYEQACREDCAAPNAYAPCLARWGMHFLKAVFHAGHVLALPIDDLARLAEGVAGRLVANSGARTEPGIDLVGFAYGEFGLAESLRALALACDEGGIPFGVKDVDLRLKTRQADRSIASHVTDALRHRCAVFCVNPDMLGPLRGLLAEGTAVGRYNIGYWFWELERLPREWDRALAEIDEIWVSTQFIAETMRRATAKPVVLIPAPIDVTPSRPYTRAEFGLPEEPFLFLFSFDFNSFASRKNPQGTIAAFRRAFAPSRRDVGLVIKSINAANQPQMLRALRECIGGDERIVVIDAFFSRDQVSGLQSVVDAFVSLHRAEGLGLGLAEAMFHGKPVIGTRYSGNLEFMSERNSCLVDCRQVPIAKGEYLYDDERFHWAEPDLEQAAHWMRRLVDDAPFRVAIAAAGQREIRGRFTHAATAAAMRRRLVELGLL